MGNEFKDEQGLDRTSLMLIRSLIRNLSRNKASASNSWNLLLKDLILSIRLDFGKKKLQRTKR